MAFFRRPRSYSLYRQDRSRKRVLRLARIAVQLFLVYILVTGLFVRSYLVESAAMHPNFRAGDRIVATPLTYGARLPLVNLRLPGVGEPQRGDLVLVEPPYYRRPNLILRIADPVVSFVSGQRYQLSDGADVAWQQPLVLKRIVGVPGDTIRFTDYTAFIRPEGADAYLPEGAVNARRSYEITIGHAPEAFRSGDPFGGNFDELSLDSDEYFVAGDDRSSSLDSRHWGTIPREALHSRIFLRYYPFNRFGRP
ncbi:MAG: signal peptidase I [Spirochaetaceae bacterium]|nr:MAG: signal peptidase I [Spirochaetaceae bacterium]